MLRFAVTTHIFALQILVHVLQLTACRFGPCSLAPFVAASALV
jgi:hypothetical protein